VVKFEIHRRNLAEDWEFASCQVLAAQSVHNHCRSACDRDPGCNRVYADAGRRLPDIKIPAVVVATFYQGMPPLDMEDNITFRYERFFTLGSNIDHIESRSLSA